MAVVLTYAGLQAWAQAILSSAFLDNWSVRLFVNLRSPLPQDNLALYTQCSWPGYSDFTLNFLEWVAAPTNTGSPWSYPLITFNFDASNQPQQTVFGYVVYSVTGLLLYAEAFSAPFPIPPAGGSIPLQLFWSDQQC
jgi:hypothetical protein